MEKKTIGKKIAEKRNGNTARPACAPAGNSQAPRPAWRGKWWFHALRGVFAPVRWVVAFFRVMRNDPVRWLDLANRVCFIGICAFCVLFMAGAAAASNWAVAFVLFIVFAICLRVLAEDYREEREEKRRRRGD